MFGFLLAATLSLSSLDGGPFSPSLMTLANGDVAVEVRIPPGHALYVDRSKVVSSSGEVEAVSQPILKDDPVVGPELLWRGEARWVIHGAQTGAQIQVTVQGCNEVEQICYPPQKVTLVASR